MTPFLIALLVFVVAGFGATALLRRGGAPGSTSVRGPAELAELRWRDFTRLVLQAMRARGYEPLIEDGASSDGIPSDGGDILLQREGHRILLSCKHGSASIVGAQAILGLGKVAQMRGANGIVLATPGRFDDEAVRLARQQGDVELLDGADLWPELRPYVAQPGEEQPAAAPLATPRAIALAWAGAAVLAALAATAVHLASPAPAAEQDGSAPTVSPPAPTAQPARDAAPSVPVADAVPTDPQALEQRRSETAKAISTVFGVDRALWSTQSTLLVYLATENADPTSGLCPLLERYPELAASRVQLQPPQGSERPVRFMQCRAY
jgi:restriction system protein